MLFNNVIAIDLGTNNTKIYKKSKGIVLDEKTSVTVDEKKNIIETGNSSFEMFEKTPAGKKVVFPLKGGVIADFNNMTKLTNAFFKKIKYTNGLLKKCKIYVAVPIDISEVERKAFIDLMYSSKISVKDVVTIPKPIAAALGAGIDTASPQGHMTVDIGADTTEIAVISLGGIVTGKLLKIGGNKLTESLLSFVKKNYNLVIGFKTAEYLKLNVCSACNNNFQEVDITGRDIVTGLPKTIKMSSVDILNPMEEYLYEIIDAIKYILEKTPPELSADIIETGIYITGGGAQLDTFDLLISKETGLAVHKTTEPNFNVINGLGKILGDSISH
ncbi:MAG: Actin-like ATPase involved in cell morphosis [Clostridiales bacterium]|jgi:rod shape-determining protein MreB|nr:Actin-like ATPase involved in cell morphosis [Clostridiales bacterium]